MPSRATAIKQFVNVPTARSRRAAHCASIATALGVRPEYVTWEQAPRSGWYVSTPWAKVYVAASERDVGTFLEGWRAGDLGPLVEALVNYYPAVYLIPTPDYLIDFDVIHPSVMAKIRPKIEGEEGRGTQATRGLRVYPYKSRGFVLLRDYRSGQPTWGVRFDRYGWKLEATVARGKADGG